MKKATIIFGVLLMSFAGMSAQDKRVSDEQKQEIKENFQENMKRLNLTEKQKGEFASISKKYGEKLKEVRAGEGSRVEKMRSAKAIMEQRNAEIKPILTEEQYKTFLQIQDERTQKMKNRRKK